MRVVIQHAITGLYLRDNQEWVKDEERALSFKSSLPAIDFCLEHKLQEVFILLKFEDPKYDIQLRPFYNSAYRLPNSSANGSRPAAVKSGQD